MNFNNVFIYDPKEKLHYMLSNALKYEFENIGKTVYILNDLFINDDVYNKMEINDIFIYLIHPLYLINENDCKNVIKTMNKKNNITKILYITEPLTIIMDRKTYQNLVIQLQVKYIWTYTLENCKLFKPPFLRKIYRVAPQYNKSYDLTDISLMNLKNKINNKIIFIGNYTQQRKKCLDSFGDDLIHINNIWNNEDWSIVLNKYLFYINIHRINNCKCLETMRIIPILSNGGVIISELVGKEEMDEYKDYNIYFGKREDLKNIFNEIKNIKIEEIELKTRLFRERKLLKSELTHNKYYE